MKRSFVRAPQHSNKNAPQVPAPASPPTSGSLRLLLRGLLRSSSRTPAAVQG